mmetsp:Transcript_8383/g.21411  ORF Transcript_8383/g.21411 Transcript_8383/m.21411 type:complete len:215 (-) Transcript_8383:866-1510(-)
MPRMSIDCNGGQALGASHCCSVPEQAVVDAPPTPSKPLLCNAATAAVALSASASPAQRGAAKSESIGARSSPVSSATLPSTWSQASTQRPTAGFHMSASIASRRSAAAFARAAAPGAVRALSPSDATATSTSFRGVDVSTAWVKAASVRSARYRMALRSTGSTRVAAVSRNEKTPPMRLPACVHRAEKSQPDSAAVAISRYTAALPLAVSTSSR